MYIKMILSLVLIFSLGSLVSCFPSSKDFAGNSNFINETHELVPKIHKSNHKKSHSHGPPVIKFLKKFHFDPSLLARNYSAISDFCNFSHWNWQLNNSGLTLSTPIVPENYEESRGSTLTAVPQPYETPLVQNGSTIPTTASMLTSVGLQSNEPPDFGTNTFITDSGTSTIIPDSGINATAPNSGTNGEDDADHDGTLTRILLLLILILQNVFLFVMVLFYRNMKKTGKKCERK